MSIVPTSNVTLGKGDQEQHQGMDEEQSAYDMTFLYFIFAIGRKQTLFSREKMIKNKKKQ